MEWVLNHMEDADFNDPWPAAASSAASPAAAPGFDAETVSMLEGMGFSTAQVMPPAAT